MSARADPLPLDVAVDQERAFIEQVRDVIADEVKKATEPLRRIAERLALDHDVLLMQSEHTANTVAAMNSAMVRVQSWATNRSLREEKLDIRVTRLLESMEKVFPDLQQPDPTPPRGNGGT